jgi:nucleotide-binding universal stress UspA family protein
MNNHYLVALDPTAEAGEAALPLATYAAKVTGGRLTVLVALGGPTAQAFRDFAEAEQITVAAAADRYLEQIVTQVRDSGVAADRLTIEGRDTAGEILGLLDGSDVTALAIPIAGRSTERRVLDRLARDTSVPVLLVPAA